MTDPTTEPEETAGAPPSPAQAPASQLVNRLKSPRKVINKIMRREFCRIRASLKSRPIGSASWLRELAPRALT